MKILLIDFPTSFIYTPEAKTLRSFYNAQSAYLNKLCQSPSFNIPKVKHYSRGILQLGTLLRHLGHDVEYLNIDITNTSSIIDSRDIYDVILFSFMTPSYPMAKELAIKMKRHQSKAIFIAGGRHATFMKEECIIGGFDFVVAGEGERTIPLLLEIIDAKQSPDIPGVCYKKNNRIIDHGFAPPIGNLDELPHIDYSLLSAPEKYCHNLSFMRGCVNSCLYCLDGCMQKFRYNSSEYMLAELEILYSWIPDNTLVNFTDPIFTVDAQRIFRLGELLRDRRKKYPFTCDIHEAYCSEKLLTTLSEMGCIMVSLGIEDTDTKILRKNNRKSDIESQLKILSMVQEKTKMLTNTYWILGLPFSTSKTTANNAEQLIQYIKNYYCDIVSYKIFVPYPGLEEKGFARKHTNWTRYERMSYPPSIAFPDLSSKHLYELLIKSVKELTSIYISRSGHLSSETTHSGNSGRIRGSYLADRIHSITLSDQGYRGGP